MYALLRHMVLRMILPDKGLPWKILFRQAIYVAMDVFRNRIVEKDIHAHPLRKQYYEKRDDSDKLKLDTIDDED